MKEHPTLHMRGFVKTSRQLGTLLLPILSAAAACSKQPEDVYLFDCGGSVQRLSHVLGADPPKHVSAIDSTLPRRVRDGCSIHEAWYDIDTDALTLTVQTNAIQNSNENLPSKSIALATPTLTLLVPEGRRPTPREPDMDAAVASARSIQGPFVRSVKHLLDDGKTVLVQELLESEEARLRGGVVYRWRSGSVAHRREDTTATGRYALMDLNTQRQLGDVVSVGGAASHSRVVCFTPSGRIYLAPARDSLVVLDVAVPGWQFTVGGLAVDLFWTGCAGGG